MQKTAAAAALAATFGLATLAAHAADETGGYAVRGAGAQPCSAFVAAITEQTPAVAAHVSWLEGYLSAHNRMTAATFDASPIVASAELAALLRNVCADAPELRLETALAQLLAILAPARVTARSEIETVTVDARSAAIRPETLRRMQEALAALGHYTMTPDGRFGPGTEAALRRFQAESGLAETGAPDADTLVRLLFTEAE